MDSKLHKIRLFGFSCRWLYVTYQQVGGFLPCVCVLTQLTRHCAPIVLVRLDLGWIEVGLAPFMKSQRNSKCLLMHTLSIIKFVSCPQAFASSVTDNSVGMCVYRVNQR